jgi:polyhydroxybutyrate depolymerase
VVAPPLTTESLFYQGTERPFLLHVPRNAAAGLLPLVLELHGRGIPAAGFDRWTGFSTLSDLAGFVLAMPSAIGEIWNDGRYDGRGWAAVEAVDDVGYLIALIDHVQARLPVDPRRIYVVGMSNGAAMAGRLAVEHAERLAAIAQVAGTASAEVAAGQFHGAPLPVLQVHGSRDSIAPYQGGRATGIGARILIRRRAGLSVGVDAWAAAWVAANGAGSEPEVSTIEPDTTIRRWTGPTPSSDVVFYRIDGGGHTWPGNQMWLPPIFGRTGKSFSATAVIWDFMQRHAREP